MLRSIHTPPSSLLRTAYNPSVNYREYGPPPRRNVLLHGGPGAIGDMAPVAEDLAVDHGVVEFLGREPTLDGQIADLLHAVQAADSPVTLVGHSWGAMLAVIFAGYHPELVRKIVMIGSGTFEEGYESQIRQARFERLDLDARAEMLELVERRHDPSTDRDATLARIGELLAVADAYDPIETDFRPEMSHDVHQGVWSGAVKLRSSGELLRLAANVCCPVVAIHGDHDPHPIEGIREPLEPLLDLQVIMLSECGHSPWLERRARDRFYELLRAEI